MSYNSKDRIAGEIYEQIRASNLPLLKFDVSKLSPEEINEIRKELIKKRPLVKERYIVNQGGSVPDIELFKHYFGK